jgi:AraC-like DNA-binding protein
MLGTIYLSSPKPVVLRARVIELLSCLTRAAIEDNPMLEPLIERNHRWTDQLIHADGFEALSTELMQALDEFIDAVYLHGVNRSNVHVHKAMEFIAREFKEPISLSHVAAHVGLSSCRLAHLVKAFTGKTVLEVIRQVRLQRAQELLDRTALSGVEIAYEVGFGDQSYFIQHFKRYAGMTPARYRRRR